MPQGGGETHNHLVCTDALVLVFQAVAPQAFQIVARVQHHFLGLWVDLDEAPAVLYQVQLRGPAHGLPHSYVLLVTVGLLGLEKKIMTDMAVDR